MDAYGLAGKATLHLQALRQYMLDPGGCPQLECRPTFACIRSGFLLLKNKTILLLLSSLCQIIPVSLHASDNDFSATLVFHRARGKALASHTDESMFGCKMVTVFFKLDSRAISSSSRYSEVLCFDPAI